MLNKAINLRKFFLIIQLFMKKLLVIICSIFVVSSAALSDSTKVTYKTKTTIFQDVGRDLGIFATDWGSYLISPVRMNGKDIFITTSVIQGTLISSTADKEVRRKISRQGFDTYNKDFWDAPTFYGYVQYPSILGGAMYAAGLFTRNDWIRITGRELIQALVYGGTLTMGIRYVLGRHRPYTSNNDQYEFEWFTSDGELQAFPSGHMVVAITTSTILAERINKWWARAILYPMALLTGYARIYNDKHWLSDVIFGAALGYGSAKFVLNQEERREKEAKKKTKNKSGGFNLIPTGNGLHFTYSF